MTSLTLPLTGDRVRLEGDGEGGVIVVRVADDFPVGRAAVTMDPAGLTIDALCIDEAHRGHGYGSEAARLLVQAAGAAGLTVRASAPPDRGLAVYFWVRMGLRPVPGEGPQGGLWFERVVEV